MSQQINLFNPVFLHQKKYFSTVTMVQALGLILLGSMLVYGYALYQVRQLRQQSFEVSRHFSDEQDKLARYAAEYSPQQAGQQLADELKKTEAQLVTQQEVIKTLKSGALGNSSGYSEYLRAFARQTVPGLWLTGFSINGDASRMSLSGGVVSPGLLPDYVQRLNREKVMRGKTFASLQMQQPEEDSGKPGTARYIEFTLQSVESGEAGK